MTIEASTTHRRNPDAHRSHRHSRRPIRPGRSALCRRVHLRGRLLDVRSNALFARGHVPGAINLPHGKIVESKMAQWPADTLFVTYCAGPHCNGAARGALRLARLGRPVKIMAGGITGWLDEGFELATGEA